MDAKKYNNIKLFIGIAKGIITFVFLFLFVYLGYSSRLENYIATQVSNPYIILIFFAIVIGAASAIIFFPLKYYTEYYLEHKLNLSNQTIVGWLWEDFKGLLVASAIGIPIILLFYFSILEFLGFWWFPFAIIMFIVSVILARIVPVLILPIFYKVTPLENENLKEKILKLTSGLNLKIQDVYKFNMSKNTKKANAAFAGLGKTKRIILGDTLLENYTDEEIESVIAHELGHFKHKHILKNIAIGTVMSFLTLYILARLYDISIHWFGFYSIAQISALPLLTLWGMIIGFITTPVSSAISRKFEHQADSYAVRVIGDKNVFINMLNKLTEQNYGDKEPNPLIEWFFYSHPSIKKRIDYINKL